jgi:maltooligosyltrehalose trehalohydrolase
MKAFEVWAPRPQRVELDLGDRRIAMKRDQRDWWRVEVPDAGPGTRYRFALDGGPPRADPRSPSQPAGIDGPSEVVDRESHRWTDQAWRGLPLASAVLYELHVGTFSAQATFDGVADRLDHLVDLGVTAVELMPVAEFSGDRGWGYDGVLLYAPHHAYGGPDGLRRLVDACHDRGLAVVMDVVYNHLGPAGNYLGEYGPYFTDRYSTPWGEAVNFDGAGSDEVRRFFLDNALMWLRDYHCDGLRLDAVHAIIDSSAIHVLEELAVEVEALAAHIGRTLWLIAESDLNDPRIVRRREVGGYGIDAQWSDDFHHALHTALTGETSGYYSDFGGLERLADALRRAFVYDGAFSQHRSRRHGRPIGDLSGDRFVGYSQNHDQVGNRALGERLAALTSPGRLRIAAALELMAPFVPMLFQGEEWAASTPFQYFTDHRDPELGRAVSQGRRREFAAFGWRPEDVPDPQDLATWRRSVLEWDEVGKGDHAALLDWYRRLIALRRGQPALTDGRLQRVRAWSGDNVIVLWRPPVVVVCSLAGDERVLSQAQGGELLLASEAGVTMTSEGVKLPPESVAILLAQKGSGSEINREA